MFDPNDNAVTGWRFLNEPLYRWFLFVGAVAFLVGAWKVILGYMKKAG